VPVVPQFADATIAGVHKRLTGYKQTVVRMTDNMHEWKLVS
jgi:hypothetical protein